MTSPAEETTLLLKLTEMKGELNLVNQRLGQIEVAGKERHERIIERLDEVRRHADSGFQLAHERMNAMQKAIDHNAVRIDDLQTWRSESTGSHSLVQKVVFGAVGLILTGFLLYLLANWFGKGSP